MPTKILVADDSATMRRVLEMTFAGEDAVVVTAESAEAALNKLAEVEPDVVFADASMAGVDGYELARRIKSQPATSKVAVVVMASQHTPYDDSKGRAAGVDDHISKPFDTQAVIDRVGQVLARPRNLPAGGAEAPRPAAVPPPAAPRPMPAAPVAAPTPAARVAGQGTRLGLGAPVPLQPAPPKPAVAAPAAPAVPARPNATVPLAPMAPPAAVAPPAVAPPAPKPVAPAPNLAQVAATAPAVVPSAPKAAAPAAVPAAAAPAAVAAATTDLSRRLQHLNLSREQLEGVLALSREVIEQVVWEVVPELAEQLIREEIKRLTAE